MATSSITKNFVIKGRKQVKKFADAIEESYQESLTRNDDTPCVSYRDVRDPEEIKNLMEKWKKENA